MILYVNGCSHTAAAEAVLPYGFAEDDPNLENHLHLGRRPHPTNLAASWCTHLSKDLNATLVCDAETASSNDRIIRTTKEFLNSDIGKSADKFLVIQWSTWEREEWLHNGVWYQVNASGTDIVPPELVDRYKNYVININYDQKTFAAHETIWNFHQYLNNLNVKHLFYSSWSTFSDIRPERQYNWGQSYLNCYDRNSSYANVLKNNGFSHTKGYHFGADGHRFWAQYMLQYIKSNNLI